MAVIHLALNLVVVDSNNDHGNTHYVLKACFCVAFAVENVT